MCSRCSLLEGTTYFEMVKILDWHKLNTHCRTFLKNFNMKLSTGKSSLIKFNITRRDFNAGYKIQNSNSKELLARFDRPTWFNLDTTIYGFKVEIRKGGNYNHHYKIIVGDTIIKLEFNKFRRPFFFLHGKKYKWKFRKFLFFKSPMKLYLNHAVVAKYSINMFPIKKMGVLKLYKACPDYERAVIIATSLCIVHYDSKK